jgi:IclR family KDG regulon transcriptional repressor
MPKISGAPRGDGVQAVVFALQILEHLAHSRSAVSVTELARQFDTTKSRIHRHLQTLVAAGFAVREEATERYRTGARLISLGNAVSENLELTGAARPVIEELREQLGHPVTLSQPELEGMRVVLTVPGKSNYEIGVKPGSMLPAHATAQGKLLLAFGGDGPRARILGQPLSASTPYTIVDAAKLAGEIEVIRKQGWAVAPNQAVIGLNALAAPIMDGSGTLVGTVAIVDSVQFIREQPSRQQIARILQAGRQISASIGHRV